MPGSTALSDLVAPYLTAAGRQAFGALLGLSAATALTHACALGLLLLLAHALEPSEFGMLSFALAAQGYLVLLGSLASGSVVVREGVRRPDDLDTIATSLVAVTATSSVLACAGALGVIGLSPVSGTERWLLSALALGAVPAAMTPQPLFDAHLRQARGAAVAAAVEALALITVLGLWWQGTLGLRAIGAVYAGKWALASACQFAVYHLTVRRFRWSWSRPDALALVRSSWPILFAAMLFFVPLSAGVVFVRLRAGAAEAASFGVAYQVANAYQILAALGVQIVQPHIYGRFGLHGSFLAKLGAFAALFLGGGAGLALAGGWAVVSLLLPPFYRAALWVMPWLVAAAALLTIGRLLSAYLLRFDRGRFILAAQLTSALLYVGGCLVVPAAWMSAGAAVLAPCAALVGVVGCAWRVRTSLRDAAP